MPSGGKGVEWWWRNWWWYARFFSYCRQHDYDRQMAAHRIFHLIASPNTYPLAPWHSSRLARRLALDSLSLQDLPCLA